MVDNTGMLEWCKSIRGVPAKWRRRSPAERLLLLEAFWLLGIARLAVLALPFKWLAVSLGRHMSETDAPIRAADLHLARSVGRAVCSAASYTPWESVCLPQAVAAQWMLKRRHVACTLYLGVAKDEVTPEKLKAHAWLRCGDLILTGREGHRKFTVVSTFS
jgi:hypothetical protein